MKRAIAIILLLCAFAACGDHVTEGYVIKKEFEPAHTELELVTQWRSETYTDTVCRSQYVGNNQYQQVCSPETRIREVSYQVPMPVFHPDDYDLLLEFCEPEGTKDKHGNFKPRDKRCKRGWVDVDYDTFVTTQRGDYYKS